MTSERTAAGPPAWHDDDEFWREFELAIFLPEHFERAAGEVDDLLELTGVAPGARALDMCCGPGRHAVELARRGYLVTGVDRNPRFLERARAAADDAGIALELVAEDMRRFVRPGGFDLAINLYTSFSYFDDPADEQGVLDNLYRSLDAGGQLVMDIMSKEVLARIYSDRYWRELPDGTLWLQRRELAPDWSAIRARWLLIKPDGARFERDWTVRLYAATELSAMLAAAGFGEVECYGSLGAEPYDHRAERLVVIARKH